MCSVPDCWSLHWGRGALGIVRNLTKNLFAVLDYRWPRALGACLLLVVLNLFPFLGVWLAPGWSKAGFAIAIASIGALYVGMYGIARISPAYALAASGEQPDHDLRLGALGGGDAVARWRGLARNQVFVGGTETRE